MQRRLTTVMVSDVVGYSGLMERAEESTVARLKECQELVSQNVDAGGGRVFNRAGDAVLAEFESPINAVRCAVAIREQMAARDATPQARLQLRFGLLWPMLWSPGTIFLAMASILPLEYSRTPNPTRSA
jgi:adenylate cyclase